MGARRVGRSGCWTCLGAGAGGCRLVIYTSFGPALIGQCGGAGKVLTLARGLVWGCLRLRSTGLVPFHLPVLHASRNPQRANVPCPAAVARMCRFELLSILIDLFQKGSPRKPAFRRGEPSLPPRPKCSTKSSSRSLATPPRCSIPTKEFRT